MNLTEVKSTLARKQAQLDQVEKRLADEAGLRTEVALLERQVRSFEHRQESPAEFAVRHGGQENAILDGGELLFPDGAKAWADLSYRSEPPREPMARLTLCRYYHSTRLKDYEKWFNEMSRAIDGAGWFSWPARELGPDPGNPSNPLPGLRYLQQLVLKERAAVFALDEEISKLPESVRRRDSEYSARVSNDAEARRHSEIMVAARDIKI